MKSKISIVVVGIVATLALLLASGYIVGSYTKHLHLVEDIEATAPIMLIAATATMPAYTYPLSRLPRHFTGSGMG